MKEYLQPLIGVAHIKQTSLIVACTEKEPAEHETEASVGAKGEAVWKEITPPFIW